MVEATIRTASQGTSSNRSGIGFARGRVIRDSRIAAGRGETLTDFIKCKHSPRGDLGKDFVVSVKVEFFASALNVTAADADFLHLRIPTS
jgi:hypothetical protein